MESIDIALLAITPILSAVERGESSISYGELAKQINESNGLNLNPHFDLSWPLGDLQKICEEYHVPCLPAMVIRADTGMPGGGFAGPYHELHPYASGMNDSEILILELENIRTYPNWQAFLDALGIDMTFKGGAEGVLSPSAAKKYYEYVMSKHVIEYAELLNIRNRQARQKCLEMQGMTCAVCGFNSVKEYGIPGIIHVHHKDPVADMDDAREVDPMVDLVPLCPNCHALVHSKTRDCKNGYKKEDVYTIDEAKAMWQAAQKRKAEH